MTASPVTSTDAVRDAIRDRIRDRIRDARANRTPLRIAGTGTWLDAGRAVRATAELSTCELSGIVTYVPGDLTLTARAGTSLQEIREATAAHNQWLALDPSGSDAGTLGATVATASAGPLSTAFGTPRDLVLGIEFVTGMATIARGGGRVVKNVAGFDLARLFTGSWGTLGVITEVTVRLHAKPQAEVSVAVPLGRGAEDAERVWNLLHRLPFTPYACEIVNGGMATALAASLPGGVREAVLFRLGGNTDAVAAQRAAIRTLGEPRELEPSVWEALRAIEPREATVFRLSRMGSEIARTWRNAQTIVRECPDALMNARPSRGIVRVIVPRSESSTAALARSFAEPAAAKRVGERLPVSLWPLLSAAPTADSLSTRIKQAFDPDRLLNPGILGEPA